MAIRQTLIAVCKRAVRCLANLMLYSFFQSFEDHHIELVETQHLLKNQNQPI